MHGMSPIPSGAESNAARALPAVDLLLRQPGLAALTDEFPRTEIVAAARALLARWRERLRRDAATVPDLRTLVREVHEELFRRRQPSLRRVINATGVVLHTGLGRAPLAEEALQAILDTATGYCNLELDLASGERGDRHAHVRTLLQELTGAADALVVNNNAAATLLALAALAGGRAAVIARGQLVEIGGSYRLPEIMHAAGCKMVEVGTTNRTRCTDYEQAIGPDTAAIVRVHTSNYRVVGFVEETPIAELARLARERGLVFIDDLGSGLLQPQAGWDEPAVAESLAAGAHIVLFSADKLLGGPQAGIMLGEPDLIARCRRHPLARALRPDKLTFAALEATLRLYRDPAAPTQRVPTWRMLLTSLSTLRERAERLAAQLRAALPAADVQPLTGDSYAGGGTLPTLPFPTWVVRVRCHVGASRAIATTLRQRDLPVLARLHDDALVLDVRTLRDDELDDLAAALAEAIHDTEPHAG